MRGPAWAAVAMLGLAAAPAMAATGGAVSAREARCLAMIAFAEAAGEGEVGMGAVVRVMRNRMAHPDFPGDACAVALQPGQFQPVGERPALAAALRDPEGFSPFTVLGARTAAARRLMTTALRLARAPAADPDVSRGALYFVNPRLMEPDRCPWFAGLTRTHSIGAHVSMRERRGDEAVAGPALDCSVAGVDRVVPTPAPSAEREPSTWRAQAESRLERALARRRAEVESLYVRVPR